MRDREIGRVRQIAVQRARATHLILANDSTSLKPTQKNRLSRVVTFLLTIVVITSIFARERTNEIGLGTGPWRLKT